MIFDQNHLDSSFFFLTACVFSFFLLEVDADTTATYRRRPIEVGEGET